MIERKITVASFDVFPNSTLKPSALQHYMQQFAREDCDEMGCTYGMMRDVNMVFVLTKLGITISKPIFAYDELTVRTYHNKTAGVTWTREFEFYRGGEEVIHATTDWVIINFDNRRIVRPKMFPFQIKDHNIDCATVDVPRTITAENFRFAEERRVRLSDLDENDHLNNCVYSDIAMDVLPYNRKEDYVKEIRMIFRHEAKIGDILSLSVGKCENGFAVNAQNTTNGTVCFDASYEFGKI